MNENTMNPICEECGCTGEELFELYVDGETRMVCADCARALGFVQCDECGEWVPEDESYTTDFGDVICESCNEDGYFTCEECGEVHSLDDMVTVNPDTGHEFYVCQDCADRNYYRCLDCGNYFDERHLSLRDGDDAICESCNHWGTWVQCEDCGSIFDSEQTGSYNDEDECWYCDGCADQHRRPRHLHDYGYKPYPEFHHRSGEDKSTALTFGVELEVDGGDSAADLCEDLHDLDEPIYMKHDGSLSDDGVEIVTHPCTLAYHQYQLRWAEIARTCKGQGYKSHDTETCGLHIHVGRLQMGENAVDRRRTAANLVILANVLWEHLVTFSRRKPAKLDRWASCNRLPDMDTLRVMDDATLTIAALDTVNKGRYQAVNLTNDETVEFRIFRGTLKRTTLIASLQLVSNLTRYAMTHTPGECLDATWSDVLSVEPHKELCEYSASRGIPA